MLVDMVASHFLLPNIASGIPTLLPETPILYDQKDIFSAEEVRTLLTFARSHQPQFQPTSVTTNSPQYPDHRNSLVFYDVPDWVCDRVLSLVPEALRYINYPVFPVSRIEAQLTAHRHNNYYKIHTDNGCEQTKHRKLTFVYYFYEEPKAFTGGDLIVYDTRYEGGRSRRCGGALSREPINNSLVFFLSSYLHEVTPVLSPSAIFGSSRFTVNGWLS